MDESAGQGEVESASASVWRFAHARRARLIIDAADYFEIARDAMANARHNIFLIGWDFDTRIRLLGGRRWWDLPRSEHFPARLGSFAVWLVKRSPKLRLRVLVWNFGSLKFFLRGTMMIDMMRWQLRRRVDVRLDSAHPLGCSHHQKIMTIDDRLAACGGIDMTSDRWDTPEHRDRDPRRHRPSGRSYGPWHDVTMLVEGDTAGALAELGRERWRNACGETLEGCEPRPDSPWPEGLTAQFEDIEFGIARTRAAHGGHPEVREIEALFVEHIARARRFVYAETQYFASRRIAEAIARRLVESDPPEFVIINPLTAVGWLQQQAMDTARLRLLHAVLEHDHARRFSMFMPYTPAGAPIYVHAKLTIIDDEVLRVGSANMNNRSMGLDSECDLFLDTRRPANARIGPEIERIRHTLIAEHCGLEPDAVGEMIAQAGSMAAMIDALPIQGKRLKRFELRALNDTEKAIADSSLLDPERPAEIFEPIGSRGLFRRGGILRRPA